MVFMLIINDHYMIVYDIFIVLEILPDNDEILFTKPHY